MVKMKFGSEETRKRLREKAENKVFRERKSSISKKVVH
jgi:hypothetical protein